MAATDNSPAQKSTNLPVRTRLIDAAAGLFAAKGFGGVSVREICKLADTSINMIHHHFGNKQGLLDAIVLRFGESVYTVPMRLMATPARSADDLTARIELLFETTLEACLAERDVLMVVLREQFELPPISAFQKMLVAFLEEAKRDGLVREALDSSMISGAMLDRIINQAQFAPWIKLTSGYDIATDCEYRQRWCRANADLFLNGLKSR